MKEKIIAIIGHGMEPERVECKANEIIILFNELIKDELTDYTDFLMKAGYCDADIYCEGNSAIDRYMHPELRDK